MSDRASSQIIAEILLIAITIVLAALLLMLMQMPNFSLDSLTRPPTIFEIQTLSSEPPKYPGILILFHNGTEKYENDLLEAEIYCNGNLLDCRINSLHGTDFIPTHHYGVKTMSGTGCCEKYWNPGEKIGFDLSDKMIHPGDEVQVDIIHAPDHIIISRDRATV